MNKSQVYTVTVGIPAHNEAMNIEFLLRSILKQTGDHFRLEKVYVICDGCSDDTALIAKKVAKEDLRVTVVNDHTQKGKTTRLNQLYSYNQSEYVLNVDGDILLGSDQFIESLVTAISNDPKALVVGAHLVPLRMPGFVGHIAYTNCILWNETRVDLNGGDHIANLFGQATMVTRDFSRSFVYPTHITCDEEFLYVLAKQHDGFRYCKEAVAYFAPASNIKELRSQATRFGKERYMLQSYFGIDVDRMHEVPFEVKVKAVLKMIQVDPVFTIAAIFFNYWMQLAPSVDALNQNGMWQPATSTKSLVKYIHHES